MTLKKGVVIDPGHTGIGTNLDPGAINKAAGIYEAEYNLKISKYQLARFKELGVPAVLSHEGGKPLSNDARTSLIKKLGYQDCLSNHNNAGGGDGAEFIHSIHSDTVFEKLCEQEIKKVGQNVRRIFSRSLPNNTKKDYYFMHRNTGDVKVTIVEYAFVDSKGDDIQQLKNDWEKMAEAIVKAYCLYRNYPYSPPKGKGETTVTTPKPTEVKPIIEYTKEFKDVPVTHGLAKEIVRAFELGLMNGVGNGNFSPDAPVTRAQLAAVAVRLYNKVTEGK